MQIENNTLYYFYDPMCSWCYAFEQSLSELKKQLPPRLNFTPILGGLAPDSSEPMSIETQTMVQHAWQSIEKTVPGMHFNFDFWTQNIPQRSTYIACRAILAATKQDPALSDSMRTLIQDAYYQAAKNPSLENTLIDCAAQLPLDLTLFTQDLNSTEINNQLQQHIRLSRSLGVKSYPSLRLALNNELYTLPINYTKIEPVRQQIDLLLNQHSKSAIKSPCVRNCCLDDQDICLGCFRALSEITAWTRYSEQEKQAVLDQTKQRKTTYHQPSPQ